MLSRLGLTTTQISAVFGEEIAARGGQVRDAFDDGLRLFAGAVLPQMDEVRPGDQVQGGVAIKACEEEVCLYPYIFRQVCTNGAIAAQTLESRSVVDADSWEPDLVLQTIREGVRACTAEAFQDKVDKMRTASSAQVDLVLNLLPLISRMPRHNGAELLAQVTERFFNDGDQSRFGLANAITSIARDSRDPALKWDLEEYGGGIAIGARVEQPSLGGRRTVVRESRLVPVG